MEQHDAAAPGPRPVPYRDHDRNESESTSLKSINNLAPNYSLFDPTPRWLRNVPLLSLSITLANKKTPFLSVVSANKDALPHRWPDKIGIKIRKLISMVR